MRLKEWMKKNYFYIFLIIFFCILILFVKKILSPIYISSDDIAYKNFLCGNKTGDIETYTFFIQYPLTYLLSLLYKITDKKDWYGWFLLISTILPLYFLIIKIKMMESKKTNMIIVLLSIIYFGLFFKKMIQLEWTVTATILCASGFIYLFMDWKQLGNHNIFIDLPGYIMLFLGMNLRLKIFYMILPLFFFIFIFYIFKYKIFTISKFIQYKYSFIPFLIVILIFGSSFTINKIAYSSTEWNEYSEYTYYRSGIWDHFGFPDYDKYQEEYEKISIDKIMYDLLKNDYNVLFVNEKLSNQQYEQLYILCQKAFNESNSLMERIILTLKECQNHMTNPNYYFCHLILILLFISMNLYFTYLHKKIYIYIEIICFLIYGAELFYLQYMNRLPERVGFSILVCIISFFLVLITEIFNMELHFIKNASFIFMAVLLCVSSLNIFILIDDHFINMTNYDDRNILCQYYIKNNDYIFLRDFYSFNNMKEYMGQVYNEKIINELTVGGWNVKTPMYTKQLNSLEVNNFNNLIQHKNLCFIVDRNRSKKVVPRLREYLKRYNKKIEIYDELVLPSGKRLGIFKIYN